MNVVFELSTLACLKDKHEAASKHLQGIVLSFWIITAFGAVLARWLNLFAFRAECKLELSALLARRRCL